MIGRNFLCTLGAGAALMYFLDPISGRRRRKEFNDQWVHMQGELQSFLDRGSRDLTNRIEGLKAEIRGYTATDHASDRVLHDRVRAKLGRLVSNPRAIQVEARRGKVCLRGAVLSTEVTGLVSALRMLRGVANVDNQLEVHTQPDIPALQGGGNFASQQGTSLGAMAPGTQLLVGGASTLLLVYGLARGSYSAHALGAMGVGATVMACTNSLKRCSTGSGNASSSSSGVSQDAEKEHESSASGRSSHAQMALGAPAPRNLLAPEANLAEVPQSQAHPFTR